MNKPNYQRWFENTDKPHYRWSRHAQCWLLVGLRFGEREDGINPPRVLK